MRSLIIVIFFITGTSIAQIDSVFIAKVPDWAVNTISTNELFSTYQIKTDVNPFYLEEDLDGDDKVDLVLWVKNRSVNMEGVAVIHRGDNSVHIIGAGKDMGIGSTISWSKAWFIYRDEWVYNFNDRKKKFMLPNPGIEIRKDSKTSVVFYWDKRIYKSYIKHI